MANQKPMGLREATSLKNHLEFEREYEAWERRRKGPSPEQKGRQEAAAILELDRQLPATATCGKCGGACRPIVTEWRDPVCPECWLKMNGDAA